jgi:hypothetical protein
LSDEDEVNDEMDYSCLEDRKDSKVPAKRILKIDVQTSGASQRQSFLSVENARFEHSFKREHPNQARPSSPRILNAITKCNKQGS